MYFFKQLITGDPRKCIISERVKKRLKPEWVNMTRAGACSKSQQIDRGVQKLNLYK